MNWLRIVLHVFEPFPVCVCDSFVWIPHCGAIFKVGAHHRHVSHCFCFLAADSEVTSQEAEHAVELFHNPIYMWFPIKVIR